MEGYKLPFIGPPEPSYIKSNRSTEAQCEFVEEAIAICFSAIVRGIGGLYGYVIVS